MGNMIWVLKSEKKEVFFCQFQGMKKENPQLENKQDVGTQTLPNQIS